jgi:hypothetical protein
MCHLEGLGDACSDAAAVATGVVAARTGSKELGDVTAREIEETTTSDDIRLAFQKLESVAMNYAVRM